jgi:hypothetical protein
MPKVRRDGVRQPTVPNMSSSVGLTASVIPDDACPTTMGVGQSHDFGI